VRKRDSAGDNVETRGNGGREGDMVTCVDADIDIDMYIYTSVHVYTDMFMCMHIS